MTITLAAKCHGHSRHWFSVYGEPGLRSPVCRRCHAPNPRPLSADELRAYDYWLVSVGRYRIEEQGTP